MGSGERRAREREDTRRRILEAARTMFVRRGYDATTMRAIAEEVEYTPTAIYHHFQNKDALLSELCALDFRALAQTFLRINRVEDPLQRMEKIAEAYVEFATAHPMQYQLMFMTPRPEGFQMSENGTRGDPGEDAYAFLRQTCAEAIATGRLKDEYRNPDVFAQMAWATVHGLVSLRIVKGHDEWIEWQDLRETAKLACRTMLQGMLKTVS